MAEGHAARIDALTRQLAALDEEEREAERAYERRRARIEAEIERERRAMDATGLRARAMALLMARGEMEHHADFAPRPVVTFRVRVLTEWGTPLIISEEASTVEEARERLIARIIAEWQRAG